MVAWWWLLFAGVAGMVVGWGALWLLVALSDEDEL